MSLKAGDCIALPPNIAHSFRTVGDQPMRLLGIHHSPDRIVEYKDGTNALQPLTAIPRNYWSRMIIRCSSALVEDTQFLGRTEEMFSRFMSQAKRENAAVMGHGHVLLARPGKTCRCC